MDDELETILRLVASGALSPEDAEPIIEALTRSAADEDALDAGYPSDRIARRMHRAERRVERANERVQRRFERAEERIAGLAPGRGGRQLRIRVTERGRQVVNLRIPIGFVDTALRFVPGLAGDQSERIRDAVRAGVTGPIIDVEDPDGDSVLISVE